MFMNRGQAAGNTNEEVEFFLLLSLPRVANVCMRVCRWLPVWKSLELWLAKQSRTPSSLCLVVPSYLQVGVHCPWQNSLHPPHSLCSITVWLVILPSLVLHLTFFSLLFCHLLNGKQKLRTRLTSTHPYVCHRWVSILVHRTCMLSAWKI